MNAMADLFAKHGVPTSEEVKYAQSVLDAEDAKAQKKILWSKESCMKDWAKLNLTQGQFLLVKDAKGDIKAQMILGYMTMMFKQKGVLKKKETVETNSVDTAKGVEYMEGNSELVNVGLGKDRAEAIRALAPLPGCVSWVKCPFTGSSEDPMRIWRWEKMVHIVMNNDSVGYSVKATCDADVKDLNQLEGAPPKDMAKSVAVKAEPKSDEEVAADEVKLVLEDAAPFIRQLQDTELKETKRSQQ